MKFYDLVSLVKAQKEVIKVGESLPSFSIAPTRTGPYIEPTLTKAEFHSEKPTIILISAVGATGKTTLAQVLSNRAGLPLLDLAKHKPVGDYTLTGLLTSAFPNEERGKVLEGINRGTFGVIIDGIDEGRSKTSEKGFEAFLDDLVRLSKKAAVPTLVLLGRTQILDTCWLYLAERLVPVGLLTIAPFDLTQARAYIDAFTGGLDSRYVKEYQSVRDLILQKLGGAFGAGDETGDKGFLSFIGYPPVLDAIVTLLAKEQNYYGLKEQLSGSEMKDIEIELLNKISSYVLNREKDQKVLPNILEPLLEDIPYWDRQRISGQAFGMVEQCRRLVSYSLGRQLVINGIGIPHVDEKYEAQLWSFLPEHPFIMGRDFQNAIFEAFALCNLLLSGKSEDIDLALEYVDSHKYNYHLVYLLHLLAANRNIPIRALRVVLGSAQEFRTRTAKVEIEVESTEPAGTEWSLSENVDIEIDVLMGSSAEDARSFKFHSDLTGIQSVALGNRLGSTYIWLPCEVVLSGSEELDLTAPLAIVATKISLRSRALTARAAATSPVAKETLILLESEELESSLERITIHGAELVLAVSDRSGLSYPIIQYVIEKESLSYDPLQKEKYMRLRRILVLFRSHSRGTLARLKDKIENKRVLGNDVGERVLRQLRRDEIVTLEGNHYFLQPANVHQHLGISWADLRKGKSSQKLLRYLSGIS
jgi:hypothetical protein